jgi:hypothetical protein
VQGGEGNEVVLVESVNVEDCMADLLGRVSFAVFPPYQLQLALTLMVVLNDAFCALYPSRRTPCWSFQIA